ncbi:hypothetical protein [Caulobacter sp. 17J80-11]|uniref:hypothetical protein n=1 Tax=Caulobacter sp. 17J80-11 TaxID=2763502 RepID=UPI00165367B9|nr:hypothetical protein [Caulobacter sp. 17J80-11]MBC6981174.1 hypothetical protein [Caulobacter sp. 17J80-11]
MLKFAVCGAIAAFSLAGCTKVVDQRPPADRERASTAEDQADLSDSWETASASRPQGPCTEIDRTFILPVPVKERPAAIARLADVDAVLLSDADVEKIVGIELEAKAGNLPSALLRREIERLEAERRAAYEQNVGSWNVASQERLEGLVEYSRAGNAKKLSPFLIRAIAKNEFTGGFVASVCGDALSIAHVSLGHSTPRSQRLPVIVFVERTPAKVHIDWGMAE